MKHQTPFDELTEAQKKRLTDRAMAHPVLLISDDVTATSMYNTSTLKVFVEPVWLHPATGKPRNYYASDGYEHLAHLEFGGKAYKSNPGSTFWPENSAKLICWDEPHYAHRGEVTLALAKVMAKALTRIDAVMSKVRYSASTTETFAHRIAAFAQGIGAESYIRLRPGTRNTGRYDDNSYQKTDDVLDVTEWIAGYLADFVK